MTSLSLKGNPVEGLGMWKIGQRYLWSALAVIVSMACVPIANSAPLYSVDAAGCSKQSSGGVVCVGSSSNSTPTERVPIFSGGSTAIAGPEGLGTAANAHATLDALLGPFNVSIGFGAVASLTVSDLIFSSTAGSGLTHIPVSMNLFNHIDSLTSPSVVGDLGKASVDSNINECLDDGSGHASCAGEFLHIDQQIVDTTGPHDTLRITGDFSGAITLADYLAGTILTTPVASIAVGSPVTLTLELDSNAFVGWLGCGSGCTAIQADADFDASHTFGFPTSGLVFNLPDGFTADSVDGRIVDNHFVGAGDAVPEPATLALFGVGLAGLGLIRRRRKVNA